DDARVEPVGGACLHQVERFTLRNAFDDVVEDDVAQFLLGGEECQVAADLAGTDEGDLLARHRETPVEAAPIAYNGQRRNAAGDVPPPLLDRGSAMAKRRSA